MWSCSNGAVNVRTVGNAKISFAQMVLNARKDIRLFSPMAPVSNSNHYYLPWANKGFHMQFRTEFGEDLTYTNDLESTKRETFFLTKPNLDSLEFLDEDKKVDSKLYRDRLQAFAIAKEESERIE